MTGLRLGMSPRRSLGQETELFDASLSHLLGILWLNEKV